MKPTPWAEVEPYRLPLTGSDLASRPGCDYGIFIIPFARTGVELRVMASAGSPEMRWEHVSVSLPGRCPNWPEMDHVRSLFWRDDETVMQLHVPRADHVNVVSTCLHLWRPLDVEIPRPPKVAV